MSRTNQFKISFIGEYKVLIHLELSKLTESGGTILGLSLGHTRAYDHAATCVRLVT